MTGIICDDVRVDADTGRVRTRLTGVTLVSPDGVRYTAPGAYWSCYPAELPENLLPGRQITGMLRVYHPSGPENPGGFDFREYLLSQGITLGIYGNTDLAVTEPEALNILGVAARVRHALTVRLTDVMGDRAGGYAAAMLLGSRSLVDTEELSAFNELGFAHILSVSGFHTGILAGILLWLLRKRSRRCRTIVLGSVLAAYCLLTGGHVPVVRASVLLMLTLLRPASKRHAPPLWTLLAAWVITLILNPTQLTSASMQLTYGAMAGLVIVAPRLQPLLHPRGRVLHFLWEGLTASAAVQLGLLLPQLYWFHQLPVLSLLLNPFVIAVGGILITLMWAVLLLCAVPGIGPVLGSVVGWFTDVFADAVVWLNGQGVFSLWTPRANLFTALGWAGFMAALLLLRPGQTDPDARERRRRRIHRGLCAAGVCTILLSLIPFPHRDCTYIQFSVSSADAALLWDHDTVTVIDTGEADNAALADYLHAHRLGVDRLILTHLHMDHAGGIRQLLDSRIPIRQVCLPWDATACAIDPQTLTLLQALTDQGAEVVTLSRGDVLTLPSGSLTVLWPEKGKVRPGQDANLYSLTMLASLRGTTMLLTGDLDGRYELYAAHPADILKVAHHGSAASSGEAFLQKVAPTTAILSCGDDRRYDGMLDRLQGTVLYGTRVTGAVTVCFADGGYTVTTVK